MKIRRQRMERIKFGLLADSHLCRQQYGRSVRSRQIFRSLKNAITSAKEAGCKYILHAGDLLDSNTPGVEVAVNQLIELQRLLEEYEMMMFIIRGNHDSCTPSWWYTLENYACKEYGLHSAPEFFTLDGVRIWAKNWSSDDVVHESLVHPMFEYADIAVFHSDLGSICQYPTPTRVEEEELFNEEKFLAGKWPSLFVFGHIHHPWCSYHTPTHGEVIGGNESMCIISPSSTDVTTRVDERRNPFHLYVAEYEAEPGKKAIRKGIEEVPYQATEIVRMDVKDDSDVSAVMDRMKATVEQFGCEVGILFYVAYSPMIRDCVPKLQAFIDNRDWHDCITLVAGPLIAEAEKKAEKVQSARDLKTSPAKFFSLHHEKYVPGAGAEMLALCDALLNPAEDGKARLNEYVEKQLGEITI